MGNSSPIFVVGAPRSGTTLTAKILGRHIDVYAPAPAESHFFEDVWTRRDQIGPLSERVSAENAVKRTLSLFGRFDDPETQQIVDKAFDADKLIDQICTPQSKFEDLYLTFTSTLATHANKTRFCDDTPKHLFYVDDIQQVIPTAKFIVLIRDPRAFLSSYKNWWRRSGDSGRIKSLFHPLLTTLLWKSSARRIMALNSSDPNMLVIQYESLVAAPNKTVMEICDFLDIAYQDDMLNTSNNNSSFQGDAAQGIFTTSIDRWKKMLTQEEVWWVQALTKREMAQLGYQKIDVTNTSLLSLVYIAGTFPLATFRALNANSEKRGPTLKYIARRVRSLF